MTELLSPFSWRAISDSKSTAISNSKLRHPRLLKYKIDELIDDIKLHYKRKVS
jgi:hypothetical protein